MLDHYGRGPSPDLIEIVREVQWPDFAKGSSLAKLEECLNRNGIKTAAFKPTTSAAIRWPHPVIVHLDTGVAGGGHYAVLLPRSDRSTAYLWSGLIGVESLPTWELAGQIGGGVLLTSPVPIERASDAFTITTDAVARRVAGGFSVFLVSITSLRGLQWLRSLRQRS